MENEAIILYAADGTAIRRDERITPGFRAFAFLVLVMLPLGAFAAGWFARGRHDAPTVEWKSNSYEIGEPMAPPTYFPPGGHKNIV